MAEVLLLCSRCREHKRLDEFWSAGEGKNPGRHGRQSRCKDCTNEARRLRLSDPEARRRENRRLYEARKRRMVADPDYRRREYRRQAEAKRRRIARERAAA